jgi:hypothetical protein
MTEMNKFFDEKFMYAEKELINLIGPRNGKNDYWWSNNWKKTKDGNHYRGQR